MAYEGLMVSVSGVRGRVGEALTPEIIAKFAAGFGAWATSRAQGAKARIVVGRDSRVSGPMFQPVVHAALQSVGCDVIDVGMVPTPTVQLAVEHHHADGGLAITASHNPIEWNALKFIGPSGLFLDNHEGKEMRAVVESNFPRATWDKLGSVTHDKDAAREHIEKEVGRPSIIAQPPGGVTLVNFTSLFYAPEQTITSLEIKRPVAGEISATPQYTWDLGDGITAEGSGHPYDQGVDPKSPASDDYYVKAVYNSPGLKDVYLTLTWQASITLGGSGAIPLDPIVFKTKAHTTAKTATARLYAR